MGCGHPSNRQVTQWDPLAPQDKYGDGFVKSTKFQDEYKLKGTIGKGSSGVVQKVVHKATGQVRVAKICKKKDLSPRAQESLLSGTQILSRMSHPNIMGAYDLFEDQNNIYIVTEYLDGGDLFERVSAAGHFSEKKAAKVMLQVLSAVSYCHASRIVHRDVKPEHFVYESTKEDSTLRLIDFGLSKYMESDFLTDRQGTPYYIAPEVLKKHYNEKCDMWSCGVILYILLSGVPPFNADTTEEILEKVKIGQYDFSDKAWNEVSNGAKALVQRLLELDPTKRYSADQALGDPWMQLAYQV